MQSQLKSKKISPQIKNLILKIMWKQRAKNKQGNIEEQQNWRYQDL